MSVCETHVIPNNHTTRPRGAHQFQPRVDAYETSDSCVLMADVPGVTADGVDLQYEDGVLTLTANPAPREFAGRVLHRGYEVGAFYRRFSVGESIDPAGITAELRNGVLTITLPKIAAIQPRRIEVRGA